jgi:hypothetical protein
MRRIEWLLEVLVDMRELWNEQIGKDRRAQDGWRPSHGSPEALQRIALTRALEARLVTVERFFSSQAKTRWLVEARLVAEWSAGNLDDAIDEAKFVLRQLSDRSVDPMSITAPSRP